jgi:outer membrane biosynthesis protein TonB
MTMMDKSLLLSVTIFMGAQLRTITKPSQPPEATVPAPVKAHTSISENLDPCIADCERQIKRAWGDAGIKNVSLSCSFRIDSSDRLADLRIVKTSSSDEIDKQALDALRKIKRIHSPLNIDKKFLAQLSDKDTVIVKRVKQ